MRSSATAEDSASAAWAGQLDTFLNTTEENLLANVQKCWASLFTPRAIFYRFEKGLHGTKISVAVVIQKMVQSDASGIAFSVHPVTEDHNQLIIEAGFGLGEAIVSGQVTPDSYVVTKEPRAILDKNISTQLRGLYRKKGGGNEWRDIPESEGQKQVLSDAQIFTLAETVCGIEKHYGFPCDIEWAMEGDRIFITQSRPITTLSQHSDFSPLVREADGGVVRIVEKMVQKPKRVLTKIFSRERTLFYYTLWHDADQEGIKKFLNTSFESGLFVVSSPGKNGEVWYPKAEIERVTALALVCLNTNANLRSETIQFIEESWIVLKPYLNGERKIRNAEERMGYYRVLKNFWLALNSIFFEVAGGQEVTKEFSEEILRIRGVTEKYTEKMDQVFLEYVARAFPKLTRLSRYVSPYEISSLEANPEDAAMIGMLEDRARNGCFLYEGVVHPLKELAGVLGSHNLEFEAHATEGITEVRGMTAYRGKIAGIARIVSGRAEFGKVKDGDILIAPCTTPDYLPIMKKARAFITDEGSLTCHAAIVAREMKKPCIVGTKIATRIFKDGDRVEVDADKGTVTVLKRTHFDSAPLAQEIGGALSAESLDPSDYTFAGFYNAPPFNAWFWTGWYDQKLAKEIGLHIEWPGFIAVGKGNIFASNGIYKDIESFVLAKIEHKGTDFSEDLAERIDTAAKEALSWAETLPSSAASLAERVNGIMHYFRRVTFYWAVGYFSAMSFDDALRNEARKNGIESSDISDYVGQPATPLMKRQEDLSRLKDLMRKKKISQNSSDIDGVVADIQRNKKVYEMFQSHLQKYAWVGMTGFLGNPLSLGELVGQALTNSAGKPRSRKDVPKNKTLETYVNVGRHLLYVNQIGAEYFQMFGEKTWSVLTEIAEKVNVSRDDILLVTPEEIFSGNDLQQDIPAKIEKRREGKRVLFYGRDRKVHIVDEGGTAEKLISRFAVPVTKETASNVVLSGQVGNKGRASGRARVVMSMQDFSSLDAGDVLITSMTTPDFVPLMQKASAIVTDIGGLLSHAVIMSRELNKPCVIGTKIATQVFKDGDVVEVDANNGIVRILE